MRTCLIRFLRWWSKNAASWLRRRGTEALMARLITFYVPANFHPKKQWTPEELRGKIIDFPIAGARKSA